MQTREYAQTVTRVLVDNLNDERFDTLVGVRLNCQDLLR